MNMSRRDRILGVVVVLLMLVSVTALVSFWKSVQAESANFQVVDAPYIHSEITEHPIAFLSRVRFGAWRALPAATKTIWLTVYCESKLDGLEVPQVSEGEPTGSEIAAAYRALGSNGVAELIEQRVGAGHKSSGENELDVCRAAIMAEHQKIRELRQVFIDEHTETVLALYRP
jgi:hypothetical protein